MNDKVYELIKEVLRSDLSRATREEIVRFYMLPRIVTQKPQIELPDEEQEFGAINRPDAQDEKRRNNPKLAEEEEEMKKAFDK